MYKPKKIDMAAEIEYHFQKIVMSLNNSSAVTDLDRLCKKHGTTSITYAAKQEAKEIALKKTKGSN